MRSDETSVDVVGDLIILRSPNLRPYHLLQLSAWGFIADRSSGTFRSTVDQAPAVLLKTLAYLREEGLKVEAGAECQQLIRTLEQRLEVVNLARDCGQRFKSGAVDRRDFAKFKSFAKARIKRDLKGHQLKAAYHFCLVGNGANFSVPGSGKTTVVLTAYEKLRLQGQVATLLVVGPPACFGPWKHEFIKTLGREPVVRILAGGQRDRRRAEYSSPQEGRAELYLTTFQTLANDEAELGLFLRGNGVRAFMVIDEAHYIKQVGGSWAAAALRLAPAASARCVLTGTPFPQSYRDAFNLFDFLWPENPPIDDQSKIRINLAQDRGDHKAALDELRRGVGPLFYRVRKRELNLMAPVFHPPVVVDMNEYEGKVYSAIHTKIREYSKEDYLRNIDTVRLLRRARLMRLRQCAAYPRLLLSALGDSPANEDLLAGDKDLSSIIRNYDRLETPAKIERLRALVQGFVADGEKVVVWSNFIGSLHLIQNDLDRVGIRAKVIFGETPAQQNSVTDEETREKIIDEFLRKDSGLNVLVANPGACAESISLHTACRKAIYYDLSYNCAQYLQSLDRIHRVGGSEDRQAEYFFLQYRDSIDMDVKASVEQKARRMEAIVDEDYPIYDLDMFGSDEEDEAYSRIFGK